MSRNFLIGVDGGTESIRAGVFDTTGKPLTYACTNYRTNFPYPGWAEQDPRDWWKALAVSVRKAVNESGVATEQVSALAVDTTCCSVVALDDSGDPLRPALIWMDVRSANQAEQVADCADPALRVNSNGKGPVSAEWMLSLIHI